MNGKHAVPPFRVFLHIQFLPFALLSLVKDPLPSDLIVAEICRSSNSFYRCNKTEILSEPGTIVIGFLDLDVSEIRINYSESSNRVRSEIEEIISVMTCPLVRNEIHFLTRSK